MDGGIVKRQTLLSAAKYKKTVESHGRLHSDGTWRTEELYLKNKYF